MCKKFRVIGNYQGNLYELGTVEAKDKSDAIFKAPLLDTYENVPSGTVFKAVEIEKHD